MKTKFIFFSAILFFILGKYNHGELVFYFFAIQMLALYIAVFAHKRELKIQAKNNADSSPVAESPKS
jgi:hypothetical protein